MFEDDDPVYKKRISKTGVPSKEPWWICEKRWSTSKNKWEYKIRNKPGGQCYGWYTEDELEYRKKKEPA